MTPQLKLSLLCREKFVCRLVLALQLSSLSANCSSNSSNSNDHKALHQLKTMEGSKEKKALSYIILSLLVYASILAIDEIICQPTDRRGLRDDGSTEEYNFHLPARLTRGKSWKDARILKDGTYLLFPDEHGFVNYCETLSKRKDAIRRIHYHVENCNEFDGQFGNRLATFYGLRMTANAIGVPTYFTCGLDGQKANGAAYLMELNTGIPGPPPVHQDTGRVLSVEQVCGMCVDKFCTWHSTNLVMAADIMKSDWEHLTTVVDVPDVDDAVIHLRLGDALVARNGRNEFKGVFPHQTYIDLLNQAQDESGRLRSIAVVTAPFKGSFVRPGYDSGSTDRSKLVATDLIDALQKAFPRAKVRLLNSPKQTIVESLVRLAQARKVAICGCSTFCPYPVLATNGIGYVYEPLSSQNNWVKNAANHHQDYRLFQAPMLNMMVMENAITNERLDDIDVLSWMRTQDPAVGNIDIVSKPIIRVHQKQCTSADYENGSIYEKRTYPFALPSQVTSRTLLDSLRLDDSSRHIIWDNRISFELERISLSGYSLSPEDYLHAAEDIALALQHTEVDLSKASVAVVSHTISPWVEYLLKSSGVARVTSIDYNEPVVCGINWIEPKSVGQFGSEEEQYNLLVSYIGFDYFGLGRHGGPINEEEDMEMIKRMHKALLPGGYLLLAIPTSQEAYTVGNFYRVYNFDRLVELLRFRFEFVARVWDGQVRGGWAQTDSAPMLFPNPEELDIDWKHRQVLVLRKE